jgi:DNA polymerase-4
MACELIGKERDEHFARDKAAEIKGAIAHQISPALTCSIGVAPNRYLAKVASDMQKPDGLTIIHEHEIIKRLSSLEPRDFPGIGPRMEERFHARGCFSAAQLFAMTPREMTAIWGGVLGERFFQLIRGADLPEEATERSSISHSKVLSPDSRSPEAAWPIAVRLLTKACVRLRSENLYTRELWLSIKFLERDPSKRKWHKKIKCFETNDSLLLLENLERLWADMPRGAILRVGVALSNLAQATYHQPSLFENPRRESLMMALDAVNQKFSDGALYVADAHTARKTSTNSIAFQRIPSEDE